MNGAVQAASICIVCIGLSHLAPCVCSSPLVLPLPALRSFISVTVLVLASLSIHGGPGVLRTQGFSVT